MVTKEVGGHDVRDTGSILVRIHRNAFYVSFRGFHKAEKDAYIYQKKVVVVVVLKRVRQAPFVRQ